MVITAAFPTDDGKTLIDRHFGDAEYFVIYNIDENECRFISKIANSSGEEKANVHADPEKAKGVSQLLKAQGVNTAVAPVFGPNIKRIRKKFVCVLVDKIPIEQASELLRRHYADIASAWLEGEERQDLRIFA